MINVRRTIQFTLGEYQHILSVHARGLTGPEMWRLGDTQTRALKHRISEYTIRNQKGRCVYCEMILRPGTAIEHFAPKGLNPEFTFHPKNLFSACSCCNSSSVKGENPTLGIPSTSKYKNNNFLIVHPYIDNPDDHLKYKDPEKTIFDLPNCSAKGRNTINFFNWNSISGYADRMVVSRSRGIPLPINQLIQEISTYKP